MVDRGREAGGRKTKSTRERLAAAVAVALQCVVVGALSGCGPSHPERYVIERDIGSLSYRRYQRVLDVELPISGNRAVGHTATYLRRQGRSEIPFVNAFVTVYDDSPGLAAAIRRYVRSLSSYDVEVTSLGGSRVWSLDGGDGDRWLLWVSSNRVIKVGGAADDALIRKIAEEYLGVYSSDLDEHGRARDDTASAGAPPEDDVEATSDEDLALPRSLRPDALDEP